jgi:hypothetical protein
VTGGEGRTGEHHDSGRGGRDNTSLLQHLCTLLGSRVVCGDPMGFLW